MSVTQSTGLTRTSSGKTLVINVPGTKANFGRVRFRGKDGEVFWEQTSHSSYFPSPPSGYTITGGHARVSVTFTCNGPNGSSGWLEVIAEGGSQKTYFNLGPYGSQRVSVGTDCYGYGSIGWGYGWISGDSFGDSNVTYSATTSARGIEPTKNPKITVGGQDVNGPATLADGVTSDWYAIAAGLLVGGDNNILVTVDGSKVVDVDIEYTYEPYPPTPDREAPENQSMTDEPAVQFEFTMRAHADSAATAFHAKLRLSSSPTMSSPLEADSSLSQTGWEYLDGDGMTWKAMPAAGVPSGTRVRYTLQSVLDFGVYYWTVQPIDNWGYGLVSSIWVVRVVVHVVAQRGYTLLVENTPYACLDLVVNLTCNGKIGTIRFVIDNRPDEQGVRNDDRIVYGDTVDVSIYDDTGAQMQYRGRVWQKAPSDTRLEIWAALGDKIPSERILKADYPNQDIGTSMRAAIDDHCAPLKSDGIPAPLGIIGNLMLRGKPVVDLFREAMKVWGLRWWVETDVVDWVCHVVDPKALSNQGVIVRYGEGE